MEPAGDSVHRVINARGAISHRGDTLRATEQREGHTFDASGRLQEFTARRWRPAP